MSWGLWKTLLRPDHEEKENPERTEITRAANYLQIGEFQLLQLAYHDWYGEDMVETAFDKLFSDYMIDGDVPFWARHYARKINQRSEHGEIDQNEVRYHRYDHDYRTSVPNGRRKFAVACGCLILFLGGGIALANLSITESATMFPPYLEVSDLEPAGKTKTPVIDRFESDGFGRADHLPPRTSP